jgi:hypothetical protein
MYILNVIYNEQIHKEKFLKFIKYKFLISRGFELQTLVYQPRSIATGLYELDSKLKF